MNPAKYQADAAQIGEVLIACLGFVRGRAWEQFIGLQRVIERIVGEAEVSEIHQRGSSSLGVRALRSRTTRPVLRGAGAGVSGSMPWEGRCRRTTRLA